MALWFRARWRSVLITAALALVIGAFLAGSALAQTPPATTGTAWSPPGMGMMWGPGGPGGCPLGGPGAGVGAPRQGLTAVAAWLGITPEQLWRELPGKSLAQVAKDHGKERAELIAFLNSWVKARLDAAVQAGRLTPAQAEQWLALHQARVEQMVDRVHVAVGPGAGRPGGPGGPGGPGPRR